MRLLSRIFLIVMFPYVSWGQDSIITISPLASGEINLSGYRGWIFHMGHDTNWSDININSYDWLKLSLSDVTEKYADQNGRLEGWQRARFRLDTSFKSTELALSYYTWGAADIFLDGQLLETYGSTGINGASYQPYNPIHKKPIKLKVQPSTEHVIAIHFVEYVSPFPPHRLKADHISQVKLWLPEKVVQYADHVRLEPILLVVWLSVSITLSILFWLFAFQNPKEKVLMLVAICATGYSLFTFLDNVDHEPNVSYFIWQGSQYVAILTLATVWVLTFLLIARVFRKKVTKTHKIISAVVFISGVLSMFVEHFLISAIFNLSTLGVYGWYIISSYRQLKGAQWAIVGSMILPSVAYGVMFTARQIDPNLKFSVVLFLLTIVTLSIPLSLLAYVSLRFKEMINEVRVEGLKVLKLSEEKKEIAIQQQRVLEEEVKRQTVEIRATLDHLKKTQEQLIHSAKMASLGELTSGIAHEIQNPLNFVNNFSEVSNEMLTEMHMEIDKGNTLGVKQIASDIRENLEKINHHGKRADAIVKNMLQHSRSSSGKQEPTDINALADEYLRLAYNGFRAKDKSFNAITKKDFDNSIGKTNIVPQDIGRVILNLINNAFYTVDEKKRQLDNGYEPAVSVTTKKEGGKVWIIVADNGNGIPQKNLDKIFQPFFTTKPTGQGTGLGLSLAYDIITKGHGGELKVETKEGEGSSFIITLPNN